MKWNKGKPATESNSSFKRSKKLIYFVGSAFVYSFNENHFLVLIGKRNGFLLIERKTHIFMTLIRHKCYIPRHQRKHVGGVGMHLQGIPSISANHRFKDMQLVQIGTISIASTAFPYSLYPLHVIQSSCAYCASECIKRNSSSLQTKWYSFIIFPFETFSHIN